MRVVIVGAGVAGGVIARGLRDLPGVEPIVVEQVAPDDHASAGNGLNIGPNALLALDRVLPEMAAELRAASLPWTRWRAALIDGTPLYQIPLAEVAAVPGVRIRWSALYRIAREPVVDVTRYRQRCVDVAVGTDGKPCVVLEHADGTRVELADADLVVACDGRYSTARARLCGAPAIRHLGVANFRLLIDDRGATALDDLEQWFHGPSRLLTYRLADGMIYLTANFPIAPDSEIKAEQKTAAFVHRTYLPRGEPVDAVGAFLVEAACRGLDGAHWSRFQDSETRFHDDSGRVLFVGDSAHAMAPTLGQGATQAIEDACALVDLLRERLGHGGVDIPALTAAYDRRRRARIEFVKRLSWDATACLLTGADPVATNRWMATAAYRDALRRLYGELGFGSSAERAA